MGSFAVQFALFVAVVSLIRALRRYSSAVPMEPQRRLLARGLVLTFLTVAITLVADAIALLRHPSVWTGQSAGYVLVTLVGVMALFTALVAWQVHAWTRTLGPGPARDVSPVAALAILAAGVVILAVYPEAFRSTTPGALLTVVAGAILLFVPLWALGLALSPSPGPSYEDIVDDVASMYSYLQRRSKRFGQLRHLAESALSWPPIRAVRQWLNPRRHRWNAAILTGIILGIALVLGEMLGEGGGPHQVGAIGHRRGGFRESGGLCRAAWLCASCASAGALTPRATRYDGLGCGGGVFFSVQACAPRSHWYGSCRRPHSAD